MTEERKSLPTTDHVEEKILRRIPYENLFLSFLFGVGAFLIFDLSIGLFVLAGGAVSSLNFFWLNQTLSKALLRERGRALKGSALGFVFRLLLILALFFIIIFFFSKKILAFAAGFSTIIVVLLVEAVAAMSRLKTWKN
jgi:hypothetical protein